MLDVRWARENPEALDKALSLRGEPPVSARVLELDAGRRAAQTAFQDAQSQRRDASKIIGQAKSRGEDAADAIALVSKLKEAAEAAEATEKNLSAELDMLLSSLPNLPLDDVPYGLDESQNVEIRVVGARREFEFEPKDHVALGTPRGMDFDAGTKLSGARFVAMRGQMARLERALAHFMLDLHVTEHGYSEVRPPLLVRDEAMFGTGQLPKFSDDLFQTSEGRWLIPTAEVPLTNLIAGDILDPSQLPIRMTAHTPCFRSEAGAAGRDTRGMIRMHQFDKVELVSIVAPGDGVSELERMTEAAESVLKRLELPYRVVLLCSGDMGFGARKTYDIEVWLPSQNTYREISSCSFCGDFQARRMNSRVRRVAEKGTEFLETLNGSGVAVGRALVAVLENGQQSDGSVVLPDAIRPYMNGLERLIPVEA
ncbi:MAG: serine--tRNA ligase [Rhodospirillales bacterium]